MTAQASTSITLPYPVWRARDLPFGSGVLSLPQRGEHALEMYAYNRASVDAVERFEGHDDTVKEYVWRRGGDGTQSSFWLTSTDRCTTTGNQDFQLITLSKDRSLRFWPISQDTMQACFRAFILNWRLTTCTTESWL
jgi:hypothetical protein